MSGRGRANKTSRGTQSNVDKKKQKAGPEPKRDVRKLELELEKTNEELRRCKFDLVTLQKNFNYEEVRKTLPDMMNNDGIQAEQNARLMKEIAELRKDLDELKKKKGTAREPDDKVESLETSCKVLQKELNEERMRNKELQQQISNMRTDTDREKELVTETDILKTREPTETNKELTDLKSKLENMEQRCQDEKAKKERGLTETQKELTNLKYEFEKMEQSYQEEKAEKERLQEQMSSMQTGSEREKKLKDKTENLKTRELTETRKESTDSKSKFEKMQQSHQDEKAEKEKELTEKQKELTDLQSKLEKMEQSHQDEKAEKERKLTETQKELTGLKSELEKMEQSYQVEKAEKERELTETRKELTDSKSKFEKMKQSYQDEKADKEKLKEQLSNMQSGTEREKELKNETENLKSRLSELAGAQVLTNNPNIADLSDNNRPTKLAEKYSELYDNEWTNVYEFFEGKGLPEVKIIQTLHGIIVDSFRFCTEVSKEQTKQLKLALTTVSRGKQGDPISDDAIIPTKLRQLRELKKAFAPDMIEGVFQSFKNGKKPKNIDKTPVKDYIYKCITLSWFMSVQDPPVVIDTENHTGNFDSNIFRTYTKTGTLIDYVVWPPLYLHEGGSMLYKGVAQGK